MKKSLKLSVHQLVDFLLRTGDIDNRIYNKTTMSEGTKIHSYWQKLQGAAYISEYELLETFKLHGFEITLNGRADGIIINGNDVVVDEIKSTVIDLEQFYQDQSEWHLGQAKCYALMYAHEHKLESISVQLTYIHQLNKEKLFKKFTYSTKELEEFVNNLIDQYLEFYSFIYERTKKRNKSAGELQFPFGEFRQGQRKLAALTYKTAENGGTSFCEAPTGIGKTISTLFPYVKSWNNDKNDKIFYLTAKNSGKETAFQTMKIMMDKGLICSDILITAKEKMCLCPGKACNPDDCPFAKGYYTKIKKILIDSIKQFNCFNKDLITEIATKNEICPFEFSLDLSLFVDCIICDYNYFFDPMVYLKRYFDEDATQHMILVDEAHNLVERGRSMYSASISNDVFKKARGCVKNLEHKKIHSCITKIAKLFNTFKDFPEGNSVIKGIESKSMSDIENYLLAAVDVSKHHHEFVTDEFMDFFFDLNKFFKLMDYYDENFCLYIYKHAKSITINLLCLDPSDYLRRTMQKVHSKVIFSATLSPNDYYVGMIGGVEDDPVLMLPSPFPKKNLCLMVQPNISLKYKDRDATLEDVAISIKELVKGKTGNYFVFVPSFEYLEKIGPLLEDKNYDLIPQVKDMTEEERDQFLSIFIDKPTKTSVGLVVLGGAFSEGIDLVNERLIGVVVVGVGLPQICFERDKIKEHFDKTVGLGFEYAYVDPGINKVMQAVGRVIRSETDRGVALLIDDRYFNERYSNLFNRQWSDYIVVRSREDIKKQIDKFWKNN